MYVCICNAVTDRQIQEQVANGAHSLTELKDRLGVASCCGCCSDLVSSFLNAPTSNHLQSISTTIAVEY